MLLIIATTYLIIFKNSFVNCLFSDEETALFAFENAVGTNFTGWDVDNIPPCSPPIIPWLIFFSFSSFFFFFLLFFFFSFFFIFFFNLNYLLYYL
jgi:hypothetical protein